MHMTRGVRRIAPLLVCAAAMTAAIAVTADAAPPQVEIRAQTKLVVDKVRLIADELAEVRGSLVDNLTGDGIGGQVVAVRIGNATTNATTRSPARISQARIDFGIRRTRRINGG